MAFSSSRIEGHGKAKATKAFRAFRGLSRHSRSKPAYHQQVAPQFATTFINVHDINVTVTVNVLEWVVASILALAPPAVSNEHGVFNVHVAITVEVTREDAGRARGCRGNGRRRSALV